MFIFLHKRNHLLGCATLDARMCIFVFLNEESLLLRERVCRLHLLRWRVVLFLTCVRRLFTALLTLILSLDQRPLIKLHQVISSTLSCYRHLLLLFCLLCNLWSLVVLWLIGYYLFTNNSQTTMDIRSLLTSWGFDEHLIEIFRKYILPVEQVCLKF